MIYKTKKVKEDNTCKIGKEGNQSETYEITRYAKGNAGQMKGINVNRNETYKHM